MSEEEKYNLIENYVKGHLSGKEKLSFEKQLSSDPELTKQYRLHRLADELVIEKRLLQVTTILQNEKNKKGGNGTTTKIILGALLIATGTFLFFIWGKNNKTITPILNIPGKTVPATEVKELHRPETTREITSHKKALENSPNSIVEEQSVPQGTKENIPNGSTLSDVKSEKSSEEITPKVIPIPSDKKENDAPCNGILLEAKFYTTASCKGESNGTLSISGIHGGTAPYTTLIKNKENEEVAAFSIPAGNYTALIQDKKGCSKTISLSVAEKNCEKEYSFNPFMDETISWNAQHQYGTLSIYERSGNLYFTKEIEPLQELQWNGYSKNGELNAGYFIFVMSLKDGQVIKGGITIVR